MSKKVLVIVERGSDGTFACYSETPIGVYSLIAGDGASVSEAKSDFLKAVESCRLAYPEDDCYKDLSFEYRYDLSSFFDYFSFLNVSEIAHRAGINPSLMRQYTSGLKTAGEKTYKRLSACMEHIKSELQTATF